VITSVQCCIAGGGPAGMMLGLLLARAGIEVLVLEKHRDFLRDFRGDTIHPSTLEVLHELGLLEEFLRLPHQEVRELRAQFGNSLVPIASFSGLPVRCPFIAMIPQWDFLDFIARQAGRYPGFKLLMQAEATGLLRRENKIVGIEGTSAHGSLRVNADLVVGADGRHSTVREQAGLEVIDLGAPIDALWFRISRRPDDPPDTMARFDRGSILVMLNRGDYWQCAFVIAKGSIDAIRRQGLQAFQSSIAGLLPFAADRMHEIASWDDVKLLTVQVNRLKTWFREGLLCIGDAAHAMSPVGGVGINLAIQDAVATANLLAEPLRAGAPSPEALRAVQKRREFPTRVTQRFQIVVQNRILRRVLASDAPLRVPLAVRMLGRSRRLQRIPARLVGIGVRPEHVRSPSVAA
jgi:2-polyprenyl-6-methoxyphenol hydroxylase-like FAD-dependent oxidoreductase